MHSMKLSAVIFLDTDTRERETKVQGLLRVGNRCEFSESSGLIVARRGCFGNRRFANKVTEGDALYHDHFRRYRCCRRGMVIGDW